MNPRRLIRKARSGKAQELIDSEFIWACTLCSRCTTDCPKEIAMDSIIRELRNKARQQGKAPERLVQGVESAREMNNNVGMDPEEFIETVEWMAEEVAEEMEGVDEDEFTAPVDKEGAEILYIPNPREYISTPHMFEAYLKFFYYSGASWTMSSKMYDISNWGYYLGDYAAASQHAFNIVGEVRRLGAKILLSTECGHGFKILRKDTEKWMGEPFEFEVLSIVELAHRWFREGRLKLKPGAIDARVTYHDPCNVGRKVGIYEPPRELLQHIVTDFVEMWPNRKYAICCGGGGSVSQNPGMAKKRLEHGLRKYQQIMNTGADILTTCCQNCLHQFNDLQSRYEMPVQVKSVIELVAEAMEAAAEEEKDGDD